MEEIDIHLNIKDNHNNSSSNTEISTNNNIVVHQIKMDSLGQGIRVVVVVGKDKEKIMVVIQDNMQDVVADGKKQKMIKIILSVLHS